MKPSFTKIHPYNSAPIKVTGTALCSVSFKNRAVQVQTYILPGSCDPNLDGNKSEQLKIIYLDKDNNHIFNPVLMISSQEIIRANFIHDNAIKHVAVPPRSVPYHLKARECPINDPFPWVSCAVIVPKTNGSIRITLDASDVNKAIISTNQPIPKKRT